LAISYKLFLDTPHQWGLFKTALNECKAVGLFKSLRSGLNETGLVLGGKDLVLRLSVIRSVDVSLIIDFHNK
tara:strand:+ start:502 stop:717 length:216 start_codon:yes stop_codon:yes gene_type:complete